MKKFHFLNFIKTTIFISIFLFFIVAKAQSNDVLFIQISPEIPGAYEEATASISSPSINLDIASISWSVNGVKVSSSIGQKSISFKTGDVGDITTISATASLGNTFLRATATVNPSEVDVLWEATDVYTPRFYKGKGLPTAESLIKITVVPNVFRSNGSPYKPSDLSYKWRRNYEILGSLSGNGVSTLSFKNNYLKREETVGVETRNTAGTKTGKGEVRIIIVDPKILFYEKNPLLGVMYNKSLFNTASLPNEELSLVAEPYFISPASKNSSQLKYKWSLNNNLIDTNYNHPSVLVVRQQPGVSGEADISLEVMNSSKVLLSVVNNIVLNFKGR